MKIYQTILDHIAALVIPAAACIAIPDLLQMLGHVEFTLYDWYLTGILGCFCTVRLLMLLDNGRTTAAIAIIQACIAITLCLDWATGGVVDAMFIGYFWLAAEVLAFVSFFDGPKRLARMLTYRVFSYAGGH